MKIENVTFYVCEGCGAEFNSQKMALDHEHDCLIYQDLKSKIQVRKAQQENELIIITQWRKKIALTIYDQKRAIKVIDENKLQKGREYLDPPLTNLSIIPLSNLIDWLNYAFGKKEAKGLMLAKYKVYLAIFNDKIIGASLADHGTNFENENYDELIFILTNRKAKDALRRAAFDVLLENYSKIVKEREEGPL